MISLLAATPPQIDGNALISYVKSNIPSLITAVIILVAGFVGSKIFQHVLTKMLAKTKLEPNIQKFCTIAVKAVYWIIIFITICSTLNIEMSSFLAIFSVAGIAVSLAIKDSLTDVAGALQLHLARPFVAGDYIDIGGTSGTVSEVGFAYTKLLTPDNHVVLLPNSAASSATIHNFASSPIRRLDLIFPIAYGSDRALAKQIISTLIETHPKALTEPDPLVRIGNLGNSSLDITVRVWCDNKDYFELKYDLIEQTLDKFEQNHIEIPYNKLDVQIRS